MCQVANEIVPVELTKKELANSKMYPNINTPEKAAVVLARARAYGLCPTVVADGLYFISGKPALSAQLVATLIKRSGKYDYRIREKNDAKCSIEFFEKVDGAWTTLGIEVYTWEMATKAGLTGSPNWKKYPQPLLFARCITSGTRCRCPDALGGGPVYCVEELSPATPVDEDGKPVGDVIDVECVPVASTPAKLVERLLAETNTDTAKFYRHYQVDSVDQLTEDQLKDALHKLEMKKGAM